MGLCMQCGYTGLHGVTYSVRWNRINVLVTCLLGVITSEANCSMGLYASCRGQNFTLVCLIGSFCPPTLVLALFSPSCVIFFLHALTFAGGQSSRTIKNAHAGEGLGPLYFT